MKKIIILLVSMTFLGSCAHRFGNCDSNKPECTACKDAKDSSKHDCSSCKTEKK